MMCFYWYPKAKIWQGAYPVAIGKDWSIHITDHTVELNPVRTHPNADKRESTAIIRLGLDFLNSLASTEVHVVQKRDKSETPKNTNSKPFKHVNPDDYQYVFIDVPKRIVEGTQTPSATYSVLPEARFRPCEHERQGHWRHFKDGSRTWINTQVINSGVGQKKEKKYVLRVHK